MHGQNSTIIDAFQRKISFNFSEKIFTRHAGLLPFADFVKKRHLLTPFAKIVASYTGRTSNPYVIYSDEDLMTESVFMMSLGKGNITDEFDLRSDAGFQASLERAASAPTLSRHFDEINKACNFEREQRLSTGDFEKVTDAELICHELFTKLNEELLEKALRHLTQRSFYPKHIILDFDNTALRTYGNQDGAGFSGFKRFKCYYPLMVYINGLPCWIQNAPANSDGRPLTLQCIDTILDAVSKKFPSTQILVRGDTGFNSDEIVRKVSERENCHCLLGLSYNGANIRTLLAQASKQHYGSEVTPETKEEAIKLLRKILSEAHASEEFTLTADAPKKGQAPIRRVCGELLGYKPESWSAPRRVFYRIQYNEEHHEIDIRLVFCDQGMTNAVLSHFCRTLGRNKGMTRVEDCLDKTNSAKRAIDIYDGLYCDRAQCELNIKQFKQYFSFSPSYKGFFANFYVMFLGMLSQLLMTIYRESVFGDLSKDSHTEFRNFRNKVINTIALIRLPSKHKRMHLELLTAPSVAPILNRMMHFKP